MVKLFMQRAALILAVLLLFSCTGRREARRKALEEIKAMPNEEMAEHPLVGQIRDFDHRLKSVQVLLDGEDSERTLAEANASLTELRRHLSDFEDSLESADRELNRLQRGIDKRLEKRESQP